MQTRQIKIIFRWIGLKNLWYGKKAIELAKKFYQLTKIISHQMNDMELSHKWIDAVSQSSNIVGRIQEEIQEGIFTFLE